MRTFQPKKWSLIKFLLILKIFLSERQLYVQFLVELRGDILRNFHESLSFIATFVKFTAMNNFTIQLIKVGQTYILDTEMLTAILPGIIPEQILLIVTAVSYEHQTIHFEVSPCTINSANFERILKWFTNELPMLPVGESAFQSPSNFEIFIRHNKAELLTKECI